MNPPGLEVEQVSRFVAYHQRSRVRDCTPVAGSVGNQDFLVTMADGSGFVLKAGDARILSAEVWACNRVRRCGVSAPEVLALETASPDFPRPFLLMRLLPGGPSDHPEVLFEAGRQLRLAHAVKVAGYGKLVVGPDGDASGEHISWRSSVDSTTSQVHRLVTAAVLTESLAARALALVHGCERLQQPFSASLLHGDLKLEHIFGVDRRLTGIIDWGDVSVGDPYFDLARLSMVGQRSFKAFVHGYGLDLSAELRDALPSYRVLWNLAALLFELDAGGDWFDVYRQRIRGDVENIGFRSRQDDEPLIW